MQAQVSRRVEDFREQFRQDRIGTHYRGWLHFAFTSLASLAVIFAAAMQVAAPTTLELLVVPATFLFANFAEYMGHRGPMHHRRGGAFDILFVRHTLEHHRFFTEEDMSYATPRDFAAVLFPPVMLFFFLGVIATPIALLLFAIASNNVAWLFVATAVGYFLNYEWLHFAYHQPPESWISRLPAMKTLRRLHSRHHNPKLMASSNFNITYPIFDKLFGTYQS